MTTRTTLIGGMFALAASGALYAQNNPDAAFTATGASCSEVTWSEEALENYPRIASACQEVMEREGKYYVRFEGEVRNVANRGREVTIDFEEGDRLTLAPPENMSLTINGRSRSVADLRPGDNLTFYVPEDQLAASFFEGEPETSIAQEVPISPPADDTLLAQADDAEEPRVLPRTASILPTVSAGGLILLSLGAILTLLRLRR